MSSLLSLLLVNVLVIAAGIKQGWSAQELMWIYWSQSVIIGFFNFIRIMSLKDFSTEGVKINGMTPDSGTGTKIYTAFFFAFHYGFFHLIYALFLATFSLGAGISFKWIFISASFFFMNHLYSFLENFEKDRTKQNIGRVMFFPYIRIIPMHMMLVFGGFFGLYGSLGAPNALPLVIFLLMKTAADLAMHAIEHRG